MSKEAIIIQSFNDVKRQYEYSVKGYDVTESVKILLKRHKEEYDKEKKIFAGIDGYLEAQKEYQSQIAYLEARLAESEKLTERLQQIVDKLRDKEFAGETLVNAVNSVYEPLYQGKCNEVAELQKQLEEKEKRILQLNENLYHCEADKKFEQDKKNLLFKKLKERSEQLKSQPKEIVEKIISKFPMGHRSYGKQLFTDILNEILKEYEGEKNE